MCLAAFLATLGCMWPAGCRLDMPDLDSFEHMEPMKEPLKVHSFFQL